MYLVANSTRHEEQFGEVLRAVDFVFVLIKLHLFVDNRVTFIAAEALRVPTLHDMRENAHHHEHHSFRTER